MLKKTVPTEVINLPDFDIRTVKIRIIGDTPLIVHCFSEKIRKQVLSTFQNEPQNKREPKNPQAEYLDSFHRFPDGRFGFPTSGIKAAAVRACSFVAGVSMVTGRGAFHIDGELIPIFGTPNMREDTVRLNGKTIDLRYRGEFKEWSSEFEVRYDASVINVSQLTNLFNRAGFCAGLGEWRPQKNGQYGMFHVAMKGE